MKGRKQFIKNNNLIIMLIFVFGIVSCGEEKGEAGELEETVVTEEPISPDEDYNEWDYENTNWEGENECETAVQSPINIQPSDVVPARLGDIQYEYEPFNMNIVDNGHTIQVAGTENSFITVGGKRFQFKQFHFHSPSEHTVSGETYPLEMHLVHQEEGTTNLAVLGVFIKEGNEPNEFLEKVFTNFPENEREEMETDVQLSLSDYIPPTQEYYTYIGSLTTPPCTVGVDWIIFKDPISASTEQIARFTDLHGNSARPVQQLNNRRVLENWSE